MEITVHLLEIVILNMFFGQTFVRVTGSTIETITMSSGGDAVLPCIANGLASYDRVFWQNADGVLLSLDDSIAIADTRMTLPKPYPNDYSLHIKNIKGSDAGMYICITGPNTKEIILSVEAPPTILDFSKTVTVFVGDQVMLRCSVEGTPTPVVTWYKQLANLSREALGKTGQVLTIESAQRMSAGRYFCVADNNIFPTAERHFDVEIMFEPQIYVSNFRVGQALGKEAELSCVVQSPQEPIISWLRNGTEVGSSFKHKIALFFEGKNVYTSALRIVGVEFEDYGEYNCLASNIAGRGTNGTVTLYPTGLPSIERITNDGFYPEGEKVELFCNASGVPAPAIKWYKLDEDNNYEFIETGSSLTFETINRTDAGTYQCVATNIHPTEDKENTKVTVMYKPEVITPSARVGELLGENIVLQCEAIGEPIPTVAWYKNIDKIDYSQKYKRYTIDDVTVKENSTLTSYLKIDSLVAGDFSTYTCAVENYLGKDAAVITLYPAGPPNIAAANPDITVKEGTDVELFCNATGIPKPNITWYIPLEYNNIKLGEGETLRLPAIKRSQSGPYKCVAKNTSPAYSERLIYVTVEYSPVVEVRHRVEAMLGRTVSIQCKAVGSPRPMVVWRKLDSTNVTDEHMLELVHEGNDKVIARMTIKSMESNLFGQYECTAENKQGSAKGITQISSIETTTKRKTTTATTTTTTQKPTTTTIKTTTTTNEPVVKNTNSPTTSTVKVMPKTTAKTKSQKKTIKPEVTSTQAKIVMTTGSPTTKIPDVKKTPLPPENLTTRPEKTGSKEEAEIKNNGNGSDVARCSLLVTLLVLFYTFHLL